MPTITGVVEEVNESQRGIKVDGAWYSHFKEGFCKHVSEGDNVSFEYEVKGKYKNLKTKPAVEDGVGAPTPKVRGNGAVAPTGQKDGIIARQNALYQASALISAGHAKPEDFFYLADVVQTYSLSGDVQAATDELLNFLKGSANASATKLTAPVVKSPKLASDTNAAGFAELDDFE